MGKESVKVLSPKITKLKTPVNFNTFIDYNNLFNKRKYNVTFGRIIRIAYLT